VSGSFRTIRWQAECYDDLIELVSEPRTLDAMIEGIDTVLASQPRSGDYIGGPANVWAIECAIPNSDRSVVIYYTFDEATVTLHRALLRAAGG
jgi:hypothetical protein